MQELVRDGGLIEHIKKQVYEGARSEGITGRNREKEETGISMDNKTYQIAVIPGDGTGPEVVAEGLKVLRGRRPKKNPSLLILSPMIWAGSATLKTGEILPETVLEELKKVDAIYLGAIGHPGGETGNPGTGSVASSCALTLDQYINLRPVILYPGVETPLEEQRPGGYRLCRHPGKHGGPLCRRRGIFKKRDPG